MAKKSRPTNINQRAKNIVDIATGQAKDNPKETDEIKAAAAALGRKGGLRGGKARAGSNFRTEDLMSIESADSFFKAVLKL